MPGQQQQLSHWKDERTCLLDPEDGDNASCSGITSKSYWQEIIPWYPEGCSGPYRLKGGYSRRELLADGVVHALGVGAGLVAFGALLVNICVEQLPVQVALSLLVYGIALMAMFCLSAVFNGFAWTSYIRALQLADHAGILFLISGTYTPTMTMACCPRMLAFVWSLVLVSFVAKATRSRFDVIGLHVVCFLLTGWCVVFVWRGMTIAFSPWACSMALIGGAFYTIGLIPWALNRIEFHNAIWHIFVLAGSACFFAIQYYEVSQPAHWHQTSRGTCQGVLFAR
mmetsp:Transcript_100326/g.158157  ORF Transcript_100326/g.158157 Transcript_100326/m.158157 type:complete len:283 (-) Transcript_100326:98-946(-)